MADDAIPTSPRSRFRAALILALIADAVQLVLFPLFVEGGFSPADDVLDFAIAATLIYLFGWQWEFMPSLLAELIPGADLVPFWRLAVANVYRKWKHLASQTEKRSGHPELPQVA